MTGLRIQTVIRNGTVQHSNVIDLLRKTRLIYSYIMSEQRRKWKVFVSRGTLPVVEGLKQLKESCDVSEWEGDLACPREELLKGVKGQDGLIVLIDDKIDKEILDAAGSNLKVVATFSVGHDHIDLGECKKRGILVGFTPDILTNAVAEHTVGLLLAAARRYKEAMKEALTGDITWGIRLGYGLDAATAGIVGLGRIGFAVAQRLLPFGVAKILYSDFEEKTYAKDINAKFVSFDKLICESDFIICCAALTDEGKGIFNAECFRKMKKTAVFINTSRGGFVEQKALYEALKCGEIAAAALDVTTPEPLPPDDPLLQLDNCVITPHIASATFRTRTAMSEITAKNILAALAGEPMPSQLKY